MKVENVVAIGAYTQSPVEGELHVETCITIELDGVKRIFAKEKLKK